MKCVFACYLVLVILTISNANSFETYISNQTQCLDDILFILRNLDSPWVIRLLDSYGKVPSGVLLGDFMWIGKYNECLDVSSSENETDDGFHGMYCLAEWNVTLPHNFNVPLQHLPLRTGVCLPDTCKGFNARTTSHGVEHILEKSDSIKKFLQCFCLFSNANKILDTKTSKNEFLCIHGIRVLSMSWIILGHTYVHNMDIIANYVELWESINNLPFQIVVQGTFSVDSFFLIGGFLLSYLYLDEADKKQGKISFVKICLHRFIRITPVYMILIAFKTLLFKHISSGPFWSDDIGIGSCEKNWWWNLLYINNFLPLNSMCVSWSWYLANDMQFFVISSLVLYILWRWNKVGLGIFLTMLVCSWAITGYISHIYNVMPLFANVSEAKNYAEYYQSMLQSWNLIYSKPYCRVAPHVIGILLAVFIYKKGKEKYVMPWWMLTVGWCVAVFCSTSVVYGLYHIKSNQVLFNVYNTFARSSFCIGVSWVIYCCVSNQGGFVNRILSSKLWIPLSRLTFCAYLYHPLIMSWYFQSQKVPFYFTHSNMVVCYLAFLMMSYGIAFVISITFEAPLINIEKLITKRERR
ncbi:nose resistant to fluoxetine protein 6-like isoform X2 [Uloborus diversus]|uniref:nose resistant to fluoxetine protein 6-like isoform X2 n=1 Tax=Uloborus diversus TaxID=327109 RepID=UPI00240A3707|nr:nose resistant to fluoxetine protein 6-like isoform X2 [Uloborus diversus]